MSTKTREVIWGGRIMGADMRAQTARQNAEEAARAADRAEAEGRGLKLESSTLGASFRIKHKQIMAYRNTIVAHAGKTAEEDGATVVGREH